MNFKNYIFPVMSVRGNTRKKKWFLRGNLQNTINIRDSFKWKKYSRTNIRNQICYIGIVSPLNMK